MILRIPKTSLGFSLLAVILILGILLLGGLAFFTLVRSENRIALSQKTTFETYYLAEAGINEVIYKLRNDADWRGEFEEGTIERTLERVDALQEGGSYEVVITGVAPGEAEIISIGKLDLYGATAQRVVKTRVIRATNPNPLAGMTTYSNIDTNIDLSFVEVQTGNMFANDDLDLFAWSRADILAGKAMAATEIHLYLGSDINPAEGCWATNCPGGCPSCNPAPEHVDMPMLDFDSDDENSYKSRADAVYTESEFRNLLKDNDTVILDNDVTYVEGDVRLKKGQHLIVNGILVADGNIVVGEWQLKPGQNVTLEVNHTPGQGSGLLSKGTIEFKARPWTDDLNIEGVLYALNRVTIQNLSFAGAFNLTGAIIAREIDFLDFWGNITLNYDEDTVVKSLFGPPADAPVVMIEHWEEQY